VVQEDKPVQVSAIIPVGERHSEATELYADYARGLSRLGKSYEMIFVLDGARPRFMDGLERLIRDGQRLDHSQTEPAVWRIDGIMAGSSARPANHCHLTGLPPIEGADIGKLVDALRLGRRRSGSPVVAPGGRHDWRPSGRAAFHGLTAW